MVAVVVIEAVAIALLAVAVFGLLRSQGRVLAALRDRAPAASPSAATYPLPSSGAVAPPVVGVDPAGGPVTVAVARGTPPVLLAFLTEGCYECAWWWRALASDHRAIVLPSLAVVTPSPSTERPEGVRRVAPVGIPVVMSSETWEAYGVTVASTFVLVSGGLVRAAGRASTWSDLAAVVARAGEVCPT